MSYVVVKCKYDCGEIIIKCLGFYDLKAIKDTSSLWTPVSKLLFSSQECKFKAIFTFTKSAYTMFLHIQCVCYIFTSLFCMSKRMHFWQKKRCLLFHFRSSFRSWDYQILTFQIFKCHDIIKCLLMKHETFDWITWGEKTVWWWNLVISSK